MLGQRVAAARQLHFRSRVVQDVILPRHPLEPTPQRHQHGVLRAKAQELAVALAVMKQVPLIPLQHRARDFVRVLQPALAAPAQENLQMIAPRADRLPRVLPHFEPFQIQREHGFELVPGRGRRRPRLCFAESAQRGHHIAPALGALPFAFARPLGFTGGMATMPFPPRASMPLVLLFSRFRLKSPFPLVNTGDSSPRAPPPLPPPPGRAAPPPLSPRYRAAHPPRSCHLPPRSLYRSCKTGSTRPAPACPRHPSRS